MEISDLKTKGYFSFDYPAELRAAVCAAVDSWMRFTACDSRQKLSVGYSSANAGVGYELKLGDGCSTDRKENFDIALGGEKWLRDAVARLGSKPAAQFLENGLKLVSYIHPLILKFAKNAERQFAIPGFADEVGNSGDAFFVRFIHYFGGLKSGYQTATPHADQGAFTLHLFESAPGLQYLNWHGSWCDMPVSDGQTVIIPGMQMQLCSRGGLRALCHRVMANEQTARTGRYSAVCFVRLKGMLKYNKAHHGRLQEKPAGFNYDMPQSEFEQLFVTE